MQNGGDHGVSNPFGPAPQRRRDEFVGGVGHRGAFRRAGSVVVFWQSDFKGVPGFESGLHQFGKRVQCPQPSAFGDGRDWDFHSMEFGETPAENVADVARELLQRDFNFTNLPGSIHHVGAIDRPSLERIDFANVWDREWSRPGRVSDVLVALCVLVVFCVGCSVVCWWCFVLVVVLSVPVSSFQYRNRKGLAWVHFRRSRFYKCFSVVLFVFTMVD